ncbi:MAG TPA: methyltransferase domain-containing protein [Gammaproteobacteria bacterium]
MSEADKWNARYRSGSSELAVAAQVVRDNLHLLPAGGRALDLAAGLGGNALLLARRGFDTHAWDISEIAMAQLQQQAAQQQQTIHCLARDIVAQPPEANSFDLIVVSRFLDRTLCPPAITAALKPGGLLFYQTWSVDSSGGPGNPAYRLQRNELLRLFAGLEIILYREEGIMTPSAGEAMLIARSPYPVSLA